MFRRWAYFAKFVRTFVNYTLVIRESIGLLLLMMVLGGFAIAKVEGLRVSDGVYFAFITGLSIGYGDITAKTDLGRVVSVAIGLIGMVFIGLTVAVATRALRDTIDHVRRSNSQSDE
jgi:hypothetical protein